MTKLAHALDIDPVELRMRNLLRDGSLLVTGSPVPAGCTAVEVLAEAARQGGWQENGGGWSLAGGRQPSAQPRIAEGDALTTSLDLLAHPRRSRARDRGQLQERRLQLRIPRTL